ncbi:hypothetical protein R3W88_027216 [Solanum pinnatisectum]|uniref:Uncharacterized protein n=1 Tax=Solanum pinnatisectum TaxID=50273 RepID=A0AAV9LJ74_9SOLN|nr:hypothetical protein R3W88_027216 [Solanum pinnatisectum]
MLRANCAYGSRDRRSLDYVPSDNMSCEHGDFECNIYFEIAQDPIKLVPIYGRGKTTSDPRSHIRPRMNILTCKVLTLSTLFGAIPSFFNLHVQGFHDATVYGAMTGVPYLFSSSLHGGYAHGFHHSIHVDGTKFFIKMFLLIVGFLLVVSLIL